MDGKRETTTLSVHRCRFVDYAPSAITSLAYPPLPLPSVKGKKKATAGKQPMRFGLLAVGHANGNIDICEWMGTDGETQCTQAWVVRKVRAISFLTCNFLTFVRPQTLPGPYPSKVDSLAFVIRHPDDLEPDDVPIQSDLRLFSSGGGSELIEWDLERGCIRVRSTFFIQNIPFKTNCANRELLAPKAARYGQSPPTRPPRPSRSGAKTAQFVFSP